VCVSTLGAYCYLNHRLLNALLFPPFGCRAFYLKKKQRYTFHFLPIKALLFFWFCEPIRFCSLLHGLVMFYFFTCSPQHICSRHRFKGSLFFSVAIPALACRPAGPLPLFVFLLCLYCSQIFK